MHRSTTLMCHCEERSDVAISQYPAGSWESNRQNRKCLPEIAPQGHFLALRAQGATSAVGLLAMTNLGFYAIESVQPFDGLCGNHTEGGIS